MTCYKREDPTKPLVLILHYVHEAWGINRSYFSSLLLDDWVVAQVISKMDWVPPRSILNMMSIKFNGFGSFKRGIALWQVASIALIRIVW